MGCCLGVKLGAECPYPVLKRMGCYLGVECQELDLGLQSALKVPHQPELPEHFALAWLGLLALQQAQLGLPLPMLLAHLPGRLT
jgi:hypothetical protein